MTKKTIDQTDDNFQAIESTISRTEQFIENNQKALTIGFVVIIAIVVIVLGFNKYYLAPIELEAQEQIFVAQQYFEKDSFNLALNGDGQYPGFLEIIDNYGLTDAANVANCYAGISFNKLGKYDNAIKFLKDFDTDDSALGAVANGNIGDAYAEKGNLKDASKYYKKAAYNSDNELITPIYLMKLGRVYEANGNFKSALEAYEIIKEKYAKTEEGRYIDKYIVRSKASIK